MWFNSPPRPAPPDSGRPGGGPATAPRPAHPSRLLPIVQCLAEGGLLAVVAAAVQALFGELPLIGPMEFALLAGAGMGWARRSGWRGPAVEAFGLPLLAVAAGTLAWLLSPEVRIALAEGDGRAALAAHLGGWVGALAVLRGHAHQSRATDEEVQDRLVLWGLPTIAIAWLVGDIAARAAGSAVQDTFTTVAFIGSLFFVSASVLALGLARLATVRGDLAGSGAWFGFVLVVAVGMTVVGIPAAMLLGVPPEAVLVALLAPIRIIAAVILLLLSPVVLLAALFIDLARDVLPEGFGEGVIRLPVIEFGTAEPTSPIPGIVFWVLVATIILLELAAVALYLWWRWHERREAEALLREVAEERSVVFVRPPRPPRPPRPTAAGPRLERGDPVGAYLLALDALAADGRWARRPSETPRSHVGRVAAAGTFGAPLARLAAAYQLIRYGGRSLSAGERQRTSGRLQRLERAMREADDGREGREGRARA